MEKSCQSCSHIRGCSYIRRNECFRCPVLIVLSGEEDYLTAEDFSKLQTLDPELYTQVVIRSEGNEPLGIGGFG